jgi:hypothetical protein
MEDIKKQAELYAESFRYKVDDGSWYEQKVRDFIAGYEAALRIHDVVGRSEQLPCPHCGQLEPCAGNSPETCYHPKVC